MTTMPQLVLTAPGQAQWTEVPEPVLVGDVDALVRPIAVATCDLDTVINAGSFPLPLPYALGHEFVSEGRAVGSGSSAASRSGSTRWRWRGPWGPKSPMWTATRGGPRWRPILAPP